MTTDRTRQMAVWEQVSEQGYRPTDWQIRRMLTEDRIPAGAALARYVGVDAYEAAGGPVLRDLFADEHENGVWLEDPALLMKLALERLQVAADELATRWKWAEARLDVDWSDLARFGRVHPTPAEPTDEEKAEIEKLHTRHDELVNMDEDEWTDELIEEAEAIKPRLAEIEDAIEARAVFKPEDIAISGCIVTVGSDGTLQVVNGLMKPASGVQRLWEDGLGDPGARDPREGRLDLEVGYGLKALGGRVALTPFGAVSLESSDTRSYRLGTRLALGPRGLLSLETERREHPTLPADHRITLRGIARF